MKAADQFGGLNLNQLFSTASLFEPFRVQDRSSNEAHHSRFQNDAFAPEGRTAAFGAMRALTRANAGGARHLMILLVPTTARASLGPCRWLTNPQTLRPTLTFCNESMLKIVIARYESVRRYDAAVFDKSL